MGKKVDESNDIIQKSIGAFGRYHFWLCFLIFLSKFPMAFHQMGIIFMAPKTQYTCDGKPDVCPCENPVYDKSKFPNTMIIEFNLICERKWLASFAQMIYQFGTLLGSVLYGMASDRFGRRLPFLVAVVMELLSSLISVYMLSYWTFNLFRFLNGMAVGGTMVIGFVHLSEFLSVKHRPLVSAIYQVPFCLGHLVMPFVSYNFRDYRDYQMAICVPILPMLLYFCFLPETPRWLMAMKRSEEAIQVLERIAKINNLPTGAIRGNVLTIVSGISKDLDKKGTLADLFRMPNLRKRTLAIAFNWLTCSYCFYGVAQYVSHLTGDIFTNVAMSAGLTTLGCFIAMVLIRILRRRVMLIMCHGLCAACFFILAGAPSGVASIACAIVGIVSEFMVFIIVYLYTSELFPTVVRSSAIGFSSMSARIGSMIAPFVIDLGDFAKYWPPIVFAAAPTIAIIATIILPETKDRDLMTTLAEGEAFGKSNPSTSSR